MAKGCIHVHVVDGKIVNVFLHLTDLPESGVIHLSPDEVLSADGFLATHALDADEAIMSPSRECFDLGDDSVRAV
jgi:hypothetical protein